MHQEIVNAHAILVILLLGIYARKIMQRKERLYEQIWK